MVLVARPIFFDKPAQQGTHGLFYCRKGQYFRTGVDNHQRNLGRFAVRAAPFFCYAAVQTVLVQAISLAH